MTDVVNRLWGRLADPLLAIAVSLGSLIPEKPYNAAAAWLDRHFPIKES